MEIYYNNDHTGYAVLVSHGFGAGWSSWNMKELAYDKRVVEWYLDKVEGHPAYCMKLGFFDSKEAQEARALFASWGYKDVYFGGVRLDMLTWLPVNKYWRVIEYDGNETIEFQNIDDYIMFKGDKKNEV